MGDQDRYNQDMLPHQIRTHSGTWDQDRYNQDILPHQIRDIGYLGDQDRYNQDMLSPLSSQSPEIRKYKRKFNGEILCGALWGVNLLVGTDNGLLLLDRSGHGKGALDD